MEEVVASELSKKIWVALWSRHLSHSSFLEEQSPYLLWSAP